jgi:hypothetical protein
MSAATRHYADVINYEKGLITLVQEDGSVGVYTQRGIKELSPLEKSREVKAGRLDPNFMNFRELPGNYTLVFEAPEITGKCTATYPLVLFNRRNGIRKNR